MARLPVRVAMPAGHGEENEQSGDIPLFYFDVTGKRCTTQEALYHFFGIPPEVLTEPRVWYARHRRPYILEFSPDRTRVLVSFESSTLSGPIIGTYLLR